MWSACTAALLQVKMHHGGGQPCSDKHVKSLDCKTWNASNRKHVARFTLPVVATTRATQVVAAFCTSIDLKFGCKSPIWSPSNQYSMYIYSLLWFCTYNFHTDKERGNQSSPGLETKPTYACGVCTSDFCTFCTLWMHTCSDRIPACEGPHPPPHLEVCPARHHQEPLTSWTLEARASVWGKLSLAWAVASWAMPLALPSSLLSLWGMPCPHPCSWAGAPFSRNWLHAASISNWIAQ